MTLKATKVMVSRGNSNQASGCKWSMGLLLAMAAITVHFIQLFTSYVTVTIPYLGDSKH